MKKYLIFLLSLLFCLSFSFAVYAEETENMPQAQAEVTTEDASVPRLMVTAYEVSSGSISPDEKAELKITFKNQSKKKAVKNIKLSLNEESGSVKCEGMPTQYVQQIKAGGTYVWTVSLSASKTAVQGEYPVNITSEYEDGNFGAYSSSDVIYITIKQNVSLDYSGAQLPEILYQEDTQTLTVDLMNTGKGVIRNCRLDFDIDGLNSGGTVFVGEIPAGESKEGNANLRVSPTALGETAGKMTISYEDEFGEAYTENVDISTVINKKVSVEDNTEQEEEKSKYPLWWAFALAGALVGGGIGAAIPVIIHSEKQRKEDEKRL